MPTSFDLNVAMFDARDKWRKEKPKKPQVFIFVLFRPVPDPYFTQLFALYATQLKNLFVATSCIFH